MSSETNFRLLQNSISVCPTVDNDEDSILVYVYPTWIAPNKLLDQMNELRNIFNNRGFDSTVALGSIVIPEGQTTLVLNLINKISQESSLGGSLP